MFMNFLRYFHKQEYRQRLCHAWEEPCVNDVIATVTANEFFISAHHLMILYICTNICKNISKGFGFTERKCILKFTKGA